jgi:signal transduction histidine kinase
LISRDGTEIPIDDSAAPIRDGEQIKGVVLVFSDVSERKLAERSKRENEIMVRLVEAQESERHRIARDLHDHLGQKMTALRLEIESLVEKCADNRELGDVINTLQKAALQIDHDIGFLSWELRPTELENLGLDDALSSFVREWSKQYGIGAEFHTDKMPKEKENGRLARSTETNIYRIVQEALNNILKHANAKSVSVLMHHRKEHVVVIIEDDGKGFDGGSIDQIGTTPGGLGLIGMRERVALLKGTLEIDSELGRGTTIMARIPVKPDEFS